jgi:hypothetical protein
MRKNAGDWPEEKDEAKMMGLEFESKVQAEHKDLGIVG